ncbi:hypothetical protein L3X38_001600 [Prunus dulcis]|uniref:Uncharacterized protein n=1 Tax=Prunus dulcis TaxID=3755 RepID=A0AAD4ZKH3_PRUDU|nr:hypothetical protein L3X38_001600 [Prunus dulcis]
MAKGNGWRHNLLFARASTIHVNSARPSSTLAMANGKRVELLLEPLQRCSPARGEGRPRRKSGSSVAPRPGFGVGPTNSGQPEGQTSPRSKTRLLTSR